jgi:hypothetical protein
VTQTTRKSRRCAWFRDHIRQVHLDLHTPEFPEGALQKFDCRSFVDELERGHVNLVALFAKCHFGNAYHDTKVGHKHRGLRGDFLMETASECRRRGIRTLAYYSLCWDRRAWDEHPDWRYTDRHGQTPGADRPWADLCLNTPYRNELVLPQLEEIARQYPVDGFFIDIPFPYSWREACYCASCCAKWKRELDVDLSPELPAATLNATVMKTVVSWLRDIRGLVERTNPELAICVNAANHISCSKEIRELCDLGVWESQPQGANHLGHSFVARTLRNDIIDGQAMTVRFNEGWGDMTLKPEAQLLTEVSAMIGNGAVACIGDQVRVDGTLEPAVYDLFQRVFGFVREREAIFRHAESVRHAAVLLPAPSPELQMGYGIIDDIDVGRAGAWGAHRMLVESHIQVDMVFSVLADDLTQFPMIILPEPSCYQESLHDRLREYVRGGGILVVVGESLVREGRVELQDVLGISDAGPSEFGTAHFTPADQVRGGAADLPLQMRARVRRVSLRGATELAALYDPVCDNKPPDRAFRSPHPPASQERSPHSFATINHFGRGKAIYVAGPIFAAYHRHNHHWLRQFMEALLRHVDPTIPYDIDAPPTLEANLMRVGDDLLLNLIHYQLGHHPGVLAPTAISAIERVHALCETRCTVRTPAVRRVVLEPQGQPLPFSFQKGVCTFTVPEIRLLSMARVVRTNE